MSESLLKFTKTPQAMPDKRPAAERRADFDEIYAAFQPEKARVQASRCSQCGIPYCQVHCPLQNNIPDWLMLAANERWDEAYFVASATNTFPEICGRICPQDRLCEGNCVIEKDFNAVTIGAVEKHITELAWQNDLIKPFTPRQERSESIGIIGAGPAGLAAAELLRRQGLQVHIYDRYDRAGGLLTYGIPNFKLDKAVVQRRIDLFIASGVQFHYNTEIDAAAFAELRAKHAAVLIAAGVYKARELYVPGVGLGNIVPAMAYLTASNRKGFGDAVPTFDNGALNAQGKQVVVVGGGDTAMDCVRTAIRQGAASVTCLYRRDRENMPGSLREVHHAEEEGVNFAWLSAPEAFMGRQAVEQVRVQKFRLGAVDASGRRAPVAMDQGHENIPADLVIKALGFDADDLPGMFGVPELAVTSLGTLQVDAVGQTNLPGVYAAGDIVRGASLVVWAIKDGRDVAVAMLQGLQQSQVA